MRPSPAEFPAVDFQIPLRIRRPHDEYVRNQAIDTGRSVHDNVLDCTTHSAVPSELRVVGFIAGIPGSQCASSIQANFINEDRQIRSLQDALKIQDSLFEPINIRPFPRRISVGWKSSVVVVMVREYIEQALSA